jgi:hypothetical protein
MVLKLMLWYAIATTRITSAVPPRHEHFANEKYEGKNRAHRLVSL